MSRSFSNSFTIVNVSKWQYLSNASRISLIPSGARGGHAGHAPPLGASLWYPQVIERFYLGNNVMSLCFSESVLPLMYFSK